MLKLRAYQIIIHIAGWLLFMALPLLFLNGGQNSLGVLLSVPYYWLFCFTYIFLFYFNAYLLIPRLFLKRKYAWYAVITLLLLTGIYLLKPYDLLLRSTERNRNFRTTHQRSPMQDRLSGYDMPPPPQKRTGIFIREVEMAAILLGLCNIKLETLHLISGRRLICVGHLARLWVVLFAPLIVSVSLFF